MDIIGIAVDRRAELRREIRALDDFIRQAELLLGNTRAPRPLAGERAGDRDAGSRRPRLMWANTGFRVIDDASRTRGEPRPGESLAAAAQDSPWEADPEDAFIFEDPSRA